MVGLQDILNYFLAPKRTGYDIPKTMTYGLILVLAVYLIFKLLKKLKIKIDKRLFFAISPYVIFGGILRVLEDIGLISSYLFVTPCIYFLVFLVLIFILGFSLILQKRDIAYFKTVFIIGLFLNIAVMINLRPSNFEGFLLVTVFFIPWLLLFGYFLKWSKTNRIVASIHMFDSTVTFVSLNFFGYSEQHILPGFLINFFGPVSFIFVKLIGIVLVLLLIDKFFKDREFNNYLKLIIGILGGATATRDFASLLILS